MQEHDRPDVPLGGSPIVPPTHPTAQPGPLVDATGERLSPMNPIGAAPARAPYPAASEDNGRTADLKHRAEELKQRAAEFGRRAEDWGRRAGGYARDAEGKVREFRHSAARALHDAADRVHDQAGSIPGGERSQDWAHRAGRGLDATADYLETHDASAVGDDLRMLIRRRPLEALAVSVIAGFLFGRAVRRS